MALSTVSEFTERGWNDAARAGELTKHYCEQLELGHILLFLQTPFPFGQEDRQFLLSVRQSSASYHKNISYRPREDRIRAADRSGTDLNALLKVMRTYSQNVTAFASRFLAPYGTGLRIDFASFRPVEEQGRKMSPKARNDLLHVDAFPTRPTNGDRILRIFTNIHPSQARVWLTSNAFDVLAPQFAFDAGLRQFARRAQNRLDKLGYAVGRVLRQIGFPLKEKSVYDRFMLSFHDYLKRNEAFQRDCPKLYSEFPPGSTWIVFTDMVPHAVLSGQFALEQTFIVDRRSLVRPDKAPANILESLAGVSLTHATSLPRAG